MAPPPQIADAPASRSPRSVRHPAVGKKKRRRTVMPRGRGVIAVIVEPWGSVSLDGKKLGNTPVVGEIAAAAGNHVVRVSHPEFGDVDRAVKLEPGQRVVLRINLADRK